MSERLITDIYGAFGRGDVDWILERVTTDTHWDFNVEESDVPWHRPIESKADLAGFFEAMQAELDFQRFEPVAVLHSGPDVVARLKVEYGVKRTGKKVTQEQVHWWTIDDEGRVKALRHFEDTAQVGRAWSDNLSTA